MKWRILLGIRFILVVWQKIRSTQEPVSVLTARDGDNVTVKFDDMQKSIAIGQSVVFYNEDILLGGGIITKV